MNKVRLDVATRFNWSITVVTPEEVATSLMQTWIEAMSAPTQVLKKATFSYNGTPGELAAWAVKLEDVIGVLHRPLNPTEQNAREIQELQARHQKLHLRKHIREDSWSDDKEDDE